MTSPAAFIADLSAPTGSRFRCVACGCEQCSRVTVKLPSGARRETELVSCANCRVTYHWPGEVPRARTPQHGWKGTGGNPWAMPPGDFVPPPEQQKAIQEAASRAMRSRAKRSRR